MDASDGQTHKREKEERVGEKAAIGEAVAVEGCRPGGQGEVTTISYTQLQGDKTASILRSGTLWLSFGGLQQGIGEHKTYRIYFRTFPTTECPL